MSETKIQTEDKLQLLPKSLPEAYLQHGISFPKHCLHRYKI